MCAFVCVCVGVSACVCTCVCTLDTHLRILPLVYGCIVNILVHVLRVVVSQYMYCDIRSRDEFSICKERLE